MGAARARPMALSMSLWSMRAPAAKLTMHPFWAPPERSARVRRRVSMPAIATTFSRCRYWASVIVWRKFEARTGKSLITRPAACTRVASTSSALTP